MSPNTHKSPTTPYIPPSRPGSYAGWYDESVLSEVNLEDTQLLAYNRSPDVETLVAPVALSSRERVRSIVRKRATIQQKETATKPQYNTARSTIFQESTASAQAREQGFESTHYRQQEGRDRERLTISMPADFNPEKPAKEEEAMTHHISTPRTARTETLPTPTTAVDRKSRKSARLTRLIVEKILKPEESPMTESDADLEQGDSDMTKVKSYELKPVQRATETFFLLLPMLGALYMLASCCVPSNWWRQRLSIVRITLPAERKAEDSTALLIGLWGWCIQESTEVSGCSEAKLLYSMDDFYNASDYADRGLNPGTFVSSTMKAFLALLPSAAFACIATCLVLWHTYRRIVKNDRRQQASKWQHLAILLGLLSTGAFWAVTKVFDSQLSERLAPSMEFETGTVPLLALASVVLLSIAFLASVLPVMLSWVRARYVYHEKNSAAAHASASPRSSQEKSECEDMEEKDTDKEQTAKKRLTAIGKRMTKIFGGDSDNQQQHEKTELTDLESAQEDPKKDVDHASSPVEADADAKRKTLLKRLTLKTKSIVA